MARVQAREQRKVTFVKGFMARACEQGNDWEEVSIANISEHGMMVKCDAPPAVGSEVTIRRRAAGATGTVRWVCGRRFGLQSEQPLDLQAFIAASAAEAKAAALDPTAMQKPRFVQRLWHWRRYGME